MNQAAIQQHKSFCRICTGHCGVIAETNANGHLVSVKGDKGDSQTLGFICSKGADAVDSHNSDQRITAPLKRMPDGSFAPISREQALTEIAEKLTAIVAKNGPNAVGAYRGSGGFFASASVPVVNAWMSAIGSYQMYSNLTIDQSAKWIAMGRMGYWPAGTHSFGTSDVCMVIGSNPLVSIAGSTFDTRNPLKRIRAAKKRGMKLIVIDPRRTETAEYADVFIQPLPGNDAAIVAAIINIIISEGWQDQAFCDTHVADFEALKTEVKRFEPAAVEKLADIPTGTLRHAAEVFARDAKRGSAGTGTGPSMSPFSNVMEQLVGCLNVICGRYVRAGETIDNPGLILGWKPKPAQVVDIGRSWESGPKSRVGDFGTIGGEMVTAKLADEILTPGDNQIRAFFSVGGNPVAAIPDQKKVVKAFQSLELLVCLEPFMTPSAELADYILPPRMPYERADIHLAIFETAIYSDPYGRYSAPIASPPEGSELCDEWYVFWALAQKMNLSLSINGQALDMTGPMSDDSLLKIITANAPVDFDTLKAATTGYLHPEGVKALPADPATMGKFTLMPADVVGEMDELWQACQSDQSLRDQGFSHRLTSRRLRHRFNTVGHYSPYLKRLIPFNPAYMNPDEMSAQGLNEGDLVTIRSDHGVIKARVAADAGVRQGVVSMTHCFGNSKSDDDYDTYGSSTNQLISSDSDLQSINAMPRMSGIPVAIEALIA
ncbi:MAG: molybdopterin-dependent oxidoreductase [Spongiibacteraceae bacterium]